MEAVQKKGLTKSIGVSNFNKRQLERLLQNSTIPPATNQVRPNVKSNKKNLWDKTQFSDWSAPLLEPEEVDRVLQVEEHRHHGLQSPGIPRQAMG